MRVIKRNKQGQPVEVELTAHEDSAADHFNDCLDSGLSVIEAGMVALIHYTPPVERSAGFAEYLSDGTLTIEAGTQLVRLTDKGRALLVGVQSD